MKPYWRTVANGRQLQRGRGQTDLHSGDMWIPRQHGQHRDVPGSRLNDVSSLRADHPAPEYLRSPLEIAFLPQFSSIDLCNNSPYPPRSPEPASIQAWGKVRRAV